MVRRLRNAAPIQSEKHEVVWANLSQDASTTVVIQILKGQTPLNVSAGNEEVIGATVKWIYLEFQFSAETITTTKIIHWMLAREPAGKIILVPSQYYDADKRYVVKRGMEMLPKNVNHIVKRIIAVRIPRHLQRLGRDDNWVFKYVATSAETINACGFSICRPQK